jgi:hypothetical protein
MTIIHVDSWYQLPNNFTGIAIRDYFGQCWFEDGLYHRTDVLPMKVSMVIKHGG